MAPLLRALILRWRRAALRASSAPSSSASSSSRAPPVRQAVHETELRTKLERALKLIEENTAQIDALAMLVSHPAPTVFVQNLATSSVHALRGNSGEHTLCGWYVGGVRQPRGGIRWLTTIVDVPYWTLCERCLLSERRAAELIASRSEHPLSDDEA